MESKNWYIIILVIALIVTIFSLINFIQFLNIRNDDDPTVAENSSLALVILNAIVAFAGFILALYCIWKLIKKDNYEPKTFETYRNQYKKTNANVPENPLEACDEISKLGKGNTQEENKRRLDYFKDLRRYPKLNIDMERFTKECNEYGITPEEYDTKFPTSAPVKPINTNFLNLPVQEEGMGGGPGGMGGQEMSPAPSGGGIPPAPPALMPAPPALMPAPIPKPAPPALMPARAPMSVTTTKPVITSAMNPFSNSVPI
jgi:hypothetical protein